MEGGDTRTRLRHIAFFRPKLAICKAFLGGICVVWPQNTSECPRERFETILAKKNFLKIFRKKILTGGTLWKFLKIEIFQKFFFAKNRSKVVPMSFWDVLTTKKDKCPHKLPILAWKCYVPQTCPRVPTFHPYGFLQLLSKTSIWKFYARIGWK